MNLFAPLPDAALSVLLRPALAGVLLILFNTGLPPQVAIAQPNQPEPADYQLHFSSLRAAPRDPAIARAIAQVSEARIRQTIETLVGFGKIGRASCRERVLNLV